LDDDAASARSLGDWSALLGVPKDALARTFLRQTGQSHRNWVVERRLTRARSLLRNPDMMVGQVAEQVGYGTAISFVRIFRTRTGMTPGEFQRRYAKREVFEAVE
ncbi:MAG: helix-turn-helix domain-containing protein, partial [Mycobacteriaceae bacterium]